ncbi:MAG: hypothetical protein HYU73_21610 [Betaproteobacteria bacterium]|nr:hypothetical protein [Betaproteobacteria bacterium]MBI3054287.1 hypothetical protein [Betaproteobacteria bacterium]
MIDKVLTVPKSTLGTRAFGKLSAARMADVERLAHDRRLSHVPPPDFGGERVAQRGGQFD